MLPSQAGRRIIAGLGGLGLCLVLLGGSSIPRVSASHTLLADRNGDGLVNLADLGLVAGSFGLTSGSAGFNPLADVNGDGVVDILDAVLVARQFAQWATAGLIAYNRYDPATKFLTPALMRPDGAVDIPIAPCANPLDPVTCLLFGLGPTWNRQGNRLLVTGVMAGEGEKAAYNLWSFFPNGSGLKKETTLETVDSLEPARPYFKTYSPDGTRIAVLFLDLRANALLLNVLEPNGALSLVGSGMLDYPAFGLDWSPGGALLALPGRVTTTGNTCGLGWLGSAIFVGPPTLNAISQRCQEWRMVSSPNQQLFGPNINDLFPAFSPDGGRLAFVRWAWAGSQVTSQVMLANVDGTGEQALATFPSQVVGRVSWSPQGDKLVLEKGEPLVVAGGFNLQATPETNGLWVMDSQGGNLAQIKAPPVASPHWAWGGH